MFCEHGNMKTECFYCPVSDVNEDHIFDPDYVDFDEDGYDEAFWNKVDRNFNLAHLED